MENKEQVNVYDRLYEYDEVKVIAMLHKRLVELNIYPDWEQVIQCGHEIFDIWDKQSNPLCKEEITDFLEENPDCEIHGREEEGYVQTWFSRLIDDFINYYYYKNNWKHI